MSKSYTLTEANAIKHMFPVTDQRVNNRACANQQKQAAGPSRDRREMDTPSETETTTIFYEAPLSATVATRWQ